MWGRYRCARTCRFIGVYGTGTSMGQVQVSGRYRCVRTFGVWQVQV